MRLAFRTTLVFGLLPLLAAAQESPFSAGIGLTLRATGGLVVADFNLDGAQDIAAAERETGSLAVWLGNFEGGFTPIAGAAQTIGGSPASLSSGDFNNDGLIDLVFADDGPLFLGQAQQPRLITMLGNGTGRFTRVANLPRIPTESFELTVADFNRDGMQDVLAANETRVLYFQGTANGEVRNPVEVPLGGCYFGFVPGEFTNDGILDLAMLPDGDGFPAPLVLRGNGNGGFTPVIPRPAGFCGHGRIAAGDFNRDGFVDLFAPHEGRYVLYLGSISAVFTDRVLPFLEPTKGYPAALDLNGDGQIDIVSQTLDAVRSSLGPGYTSLLSSEATQVGTVTVQIAAADLNADGRTDLAIAGLSNILILRNRGLGASAAAPQTITFAPIATRSVAQSPFPLTASTSSGLPLQYTSLSSSVCTVANGQVTLRGTGICTIAANQYGNWTFAAAVGVRQSFQVTTALQAQTINFPLIPTKTLGDPAFAITATASSGLTVSVISATPSVCAVSERTVTLLGLGQCTLTATQEGNALFAAATPVQRSFGVVPLAPLVPTIASVNNGASYATGLAARGSYASIFGTQLLPAPVLTLRDSAGAEYTLVSTFAGEKQINFLVPENAALGSGTIRVTTVNGSAQAPITVSVIAPGLFSADGSGQGLAAAQVLIVNADRSVTTRLVTDGPIPMLQGTEVYLVLYGTGIRGAGVTSEASVGGRTVEVQYKGAQGTFPGLDQVNLRVPQSLSGAGVVDIRVTLDGLAANVVRANFQ